MAAPLTPLPNAQIVDRAGVLLAPWQAWLNQLYVYVASPSSGGGGVVPNSRKINTTSPLTGGGALTSDLTLAIAANGISNSLLATMAGNTLKGNNTGSPATPTDLTASQVKTLLAISLTTDVSGTLQAAQFPALTGAVTTTAGSLATTLAASIVTNANLATMAPATFKGNNTAGTTNPQDLTVTQMQTALSIAASANPSASVGLAAVNGSASTYMRSDAAPALSVAITPTWTGAHTFSGNTVTIKNSLALALDSAAANTQIYSSWAVNAVIQGYFGIAGAATNLIGDSGAGDFCWRSQGNTIRLSVNSGTSSALVLNSTGLKLAGEFACNGGTLTAALSGFGSPSGTPTSGLTNAATLAQTAGTLAALLAYLKTIGLIAA